MPKLEEPEYSIPKGSNEEIFKELDNRFYAERDKIQKRAEKLKKCLMTSKGLYPQYTHVFSQMVDSITYAEWIQVGRVRDKVLFNRDYIPTENDDLDKYSKGEE